MSRKDYRAAAALMAAAIAEGTAMAEATGDTAALRMAIAIAEGLAAMFAADNGRFNRQTFYGACGIADPWNPREMVGAFA